MSFIVSSAQGRRCQRHPYYMAHLLAAFESHGGSFHCGSGETILTSIHEDLGWIPGLSGLVLP